MLSTVIITETKHHVHVFAHHIVKDDMHITSYFAPRFVASVPFLLDGYTEKMDVFYISYQKYCKL